MVQTSYPYDAGAGAAVVEGQWQAMARRFLGTGVIGGYLNQLLVSADGSALSVSVATGDAFVEGFFYRNDAALALTVATANATNPRVDTVVVRLDRTANTAVLAVVTGTPAASPVAPTLSVLDTLYELALANVTVPAAAGVIVAGNVTDRRAFAGPSAPATINASGPTVRPLTLRAATAQSVNILELQLGTGLVRGGASASGDLFARGGYFGALTSLSGAHVAVQPEFAVNIGLVVRGAAAQTSSLAEFQNSAGTVLAKVDSSGAVTTTQIVQTAVTVGSVSPAAGAAGALPATPEGYLRLTVNGLIRKIPFYVDNG